ncbi:MAG: tRNA adenosine(34) deaminase TadA [Desulfobacterales bacterium]|nr:tRNA adenosine(34) deaminase TadA [Desulfobacterales bacterium]
MHSNYKEFMNLALEWARAAGEKGEVPVGAALVSADQEVLAAAHNRTIGRMDPTAHAEILALREAARRIRNYRLLNTTLYVTVEPCVMCMGAIIHARVARVVFGARDPKWGAAGSIYNFSENPRFNHHPEIVAGVNEADCASLMKNFFKARRLKKVGKRSVPRPPA